MTISRGVFAGANRPFQLRVSRPATPASAMVGTSGSTGERFVPVTPSGRIEPLLMNGSPVDCGTTAS